MFITKFLPVAVPAYLICLHMVLCYKEDQTNRIDIARYHRIYNRCSMKHVEIRKKVVYANASNDSSFSILEVMSRPQSNGVMALTIMGNRTGLFLCMDKRGKLITRFHWNNSGCLFKESTIDGYTEFHLIDREDWSLGFNVQGKPLVSCSKNRRHRHLAHCQPNYNRKCHQFIKREVTKSKGKGPHYGPTFSSDSLAAKVNREEGAKHPDSQNKQSKGKRRRRSRKSTIRPMTLLIPTVPTSSSGPLVRFRRDDRDFLRTLRLLKLVL